MSASTCTAWIADEWGSAECERTDAHELHEGRSDQRPDQVVSWYDDDPGARCDCEGGQETAKAQKAAVADLRTIACRTGRPRCTPQQVDQLREGNPDAKVIQ